MNQKQDPFAYFTSWSLLITFSIFIWTLIIKSPKWLFLFAACFLTTTSIMGTFFITIPMKQLLLEDLLIHSGPLILFLLLFNVLNRRTIADTPFPLFRLGSRQFTLKGYHKIILLSLIVIFSYLGYIKFENVYLYDYITLIVLSVSIFVTSYQVYSGLGIN